MRILLVHNRYVHQGGEEQAVENLDQELKRRGHEVRRFETSSRAWREHPLWRKPLDALGTIYSVSSARQFREAIQSWKPDLAHIHNVFPVFSPSLYSVAKQHHLPVVQTLHNYRFLCANGLFLTPGRQLCERCKGGNFWNAVRLGCYQNSRLKSVPMALSLALHRSTFQKDIQVFTAPSQFLKNKLSEGGFLAEKIVVLPNFPSGRAMAVSRADPPFVVYAGRLSREKGVETLVQTFQQLKNIPLKIIGDGPLSTLSRSTGGTAPIEFLGHRSHEETQRWIAQASAVVIPSECYENLPQVALEAWAAGTPLIVSQIGGLVELVEKHGAALGFQAGQADDLARLVRRCMEDSGLRSRLQEAGRKALESRFHPDTIYAGLMDVYQQAMTSKSIVKAPSSRI